jgi:hypothetical protein
MLDLWFPWQWLQRVQQFGLKGNILRRNILPPSLGSKSKPSKRPAVCCQVYIRQTGNLIDTRVKERRQHVNPEYPEKSGMKEHNINSGHHIQLQDTNIVTTNKPRYTDHTIREVTETELHLSNTNRVDDFCLSNECLSSFP